MELKKKSSAGLLTAVVLALAVGPLATAEDRSPPPWRGQPLTTFQHWDFSKPPPNYPSTVGPDTEFQGPTTSNNPFATKIEELSVCVRGLLPPKVEWLDAFLGLQGVWRLEVVEWKGGDWIWGYLSFEIKNAGRPAHTKEIRVQVTSKEVAGAPELYVLKRLPPPRYWEEVPIAQEGASQALAGGLTHRVYVARLDDCPTGELLDVDPPKGGVIYIDQVVVDTICRPVEQQQQR